MDFRLALNIKPFTKQLNIRDQVMLLGSCFTDHISNRFQQHKFKVLENPHGVIFNPASISNAITSYINRKQYKPGDLFLFNELWTSWEHHSRFSHPDQQACLSLINESTSNAHLFLKTANLVIITLGSSFVYELKDENYGGTPGAVAANCHKIPAQHFNHRLMQYSEVESHLSKAVSSIQQFNAAANIIFTISPVRHYREGLVENNRSKALLHTAVHAMEQQFVQVSYFPSYELVIDDLRDYRFYAEDMVHPNYQATNYVWEKFTEAAIDEESRGIMKQLLSIHHAKNHKPIHAGSKQHQQFLQSMLAKVRQLSAQYPFLDLENERAYFENYEND
ncbi:MAG: GSCFA domain-containing protein [Bacteroidota bacterium]